MPNPPWGAMATWRDASVAAVSPFFLCLALVGAMNMDSCVINAVCFVIWYVFGTYRSWYFGSLGR